MRKDIMVDIETLGTGENATVFQISAMSFNIQTGDKHDSINLIGDIEKYNSLNVDGSTLKWWLNTDKELLTELINKGTYGEHELFEELYIWLLKQSNTGDMKDVYLWGNGILFDNAKLQTNLNGCSGLRYPIFYRNDRDVRTILELASMKSGLTEDEIKIYVTNENERKHDAFDDIAYQIRLVVKCYDILMNEAPQYLPVAEPKPLFQLVQGICTSQVKTGDAVFAIDTNHNLTKGKEYVIKGIYPEGEITVVNDLGMMVIYSHEWFYIK